MVNTIVRGSTEENKLLSDFRSWGGGNNFIIYHANFTTFARKFQHHLHKIQTAFSAARMQAINTGNSHQKITPGNAAHKKFTRKLAVAIDVQRGRSILLDIWAPFQPIKDIISTDVEQHRANLVSRGSDVSSSKRIDRESRGRFSFTPIDVMKCRGIDDQIRPDTLQSGFHRV